MAYSAYSDIQNRYGAAFALAVADTENVGTPNATACTMAADDAANEIEAAVQVKYPLLMAQIRANPPPIFTRWSVDLMVYYLASSPGRALTDEIKDRAALVRRALQHVAEGTATLALDPQPVSQTAPRRIHSDRRTTSRRDLDGIL